MKEGVALLLIMIVTLSAYDTFLEYKRKECNLSNYVNKFVVLITTGEIYKAVDYSLNFVDEEIVYLENLKDYGTQLEVHPNEISIIENKLFLENKT